MRFLLAVALIGLLVGPSYAQEKPVPGYRASEKDKTPTEKAADVEAERAYKRSLGNIPDQGPTDPWGNVRSDGAPKPVTKASVTKASVAKGSVAKTSVAKTSQAKTGNTN
jgi:hypothetical protein